MKRNAMGLISMKYLMLFALLVATSAVAQTGHTLILDYNEFGPQVEAYELLGMQWWQWQPHGDSRPRKYDIKVVVYKGIDLETVKAKYPVDSRREKDYRYVKYSDALQYLDERIQEIEIPELTAKLKVTRVRIQDFFDK